ncbi:hypothetical protein ACLEUR_26300, partial [Escherichia coli]
LSGAPGCVTWELILDGYSESSYSATPRFAAARLPWFILKPKRCPTFILNTTSSAGNNLIPVLGSYNR